MATTYSVEQLLVKESGRIGPDIYRKTVDTSPWLKLVKQDAWPDEMGDSISTLIYERSLPYDSSGNLKTNWQTLQSNAVVGTANDGVGTETHPSNTGQTNAVAPLGGTVEFGTRLRSYNLSHTSLNSPDISLNDMRFPLKRKEQLSNIMSILTESTREVWVERYRDEYIRLSENKLTATIRAAGAGENNTFGVINKPDTTNAVNAGVIGFGAPDASASNNLELTQGILDRLYFALLRDGAAEEAYSRVNGAPVFLLITSMEASDALIRANADVRQDFRWSDRVNELLAPLGVQRTYRNYFHLVDPFLPRYNYDTGTSAWVRVRPYTRTADGSARGVRYDLNPNYLTAEYEDSIVFCPTVFTSLVPKPLSVGSDMEFAPQNYRGEFTWRNIPDRQANPDSTVGFFRGIFANGSKPIFPNHGYVIRHKRSAPAIV